MTFAETLPENLRCETNLLTHLECPVPEKHVLKNLPCYLWISHNDLLVGLPVWSFPGCNNSLPPSFPVIPNYPRNPSQVVASPELFPAPPLSSRWRQVVFLMFPDTLPPRRALLLPGPVCSLSRAQPSTGGHGAYSSKGSRKLGPWARRPRALSRYFQIDYLLR